MNLCVWSQFSQNFVPGLSIIDVLMFNSKEEIKTISKAFDLRNTAQYYVDRIINEEDVDFIIEQAPLFVNASSTFLFVTGSYLCERAFASSQWAYWANTPRHCSPVRVSPVTPPNCRCSLHSTVTYSSGDTTSIVHCLSQAHQPPTKKPLSV
jgi:hypothetical protein